VSTSFSCGSEFYAYICINIAMGPAKYAALQLVCLLYFLDLKSSCSHQASMLICCHRDRPDSWCSKRGSLAQAVIQCPSTPAFPSSFESRDFWQNLYIYKAIETWVLIFNEIFQIRLWSDLASSFYRAPDNQTWSVFIHVSQVHLMSCLSSKKEPQDSCTQWTIHMSPVPCSWFFSACEEPECLVPREFIILGPILHQKSTRNWVYGRLRDTRRYWDFDGQLFPFQAAECITLPHLPSMLSGGSAHRAPHLPHPLGAILPSCALDIRQSIYDFSGTTKLGSSGIRLSQWDLPLDHITAVSCGSFCQRVGSDKM
jgi:hypothetical protein